MNKDDKKMKYKISELKKTYNSYNYPGPQRMYELLKDKGITKEEIRAFIEKQQPEQAFRPVYYPRKASQGSIVAYYPNERWQMDIFSLFHFVSSWKKSSYKYAFCVIDVFTRKAWTVPMTHKNANCTINALQQILSEVNNEKNRKDYQKETEMHRKPSQKSQHQSLQQRTTSLQKKKISTNFQK